MSDSSIPEVYLRGLFQRAMAMVDVGQAVRATVSCNDEAINVGDHRYLLGEFDSVQVIALGKAAVAMAETVVNAIFPHLGAGRELRGLVISGVRPTLALPGLEYLVTGHPYPNAASRVAAQQVMALLKTCDLQTLVFFLISGGGSAMMEQPLVESISIEDTVKFYKALVSSGLPIVQMNALRKHFSSVKGGRLAGAADGATHCTLIVSDVPDGALDMVASGPSMPDISTAQECHAILKSGRLHDLLPPSVRDLFDDPQLGETMKPHDSAFQKGTVIPVLSNSNLLDAVASLVSADGYLAVVDNTCDDWDYASAGAYLLDRLRGLCQDHSRVCLISGGEVSVRLPARVGRGGRNQQFALWSALVLSQTQEPFTILSAGTDGLDGNSPAAGAIVDRHTCSKGQAFGLDPRAALEGFDSFSFLSAVSAAIISGPTGNNIRDLRVLVATG